MSRLWTFLAVALPVLGALVAGLPSVDLAYQLRAGAEILDARAVPAADTWTFTAAGLPWTDQQWGAQVVLAFFYQVGSWTGLVLLRAVLVGTIFGCLFLIGRRRALGSRTAALLALAAFVVAAPALGLRPQLFGMALLAVTLILVSERRTHPRVLWAVPFLVLVWANLHGSFFLGPLVLGLAWLEDLHDRVERPHRALLAGAIAALAACVTPFGPAVWVYAVGLSVNPEVTRRISEWQPTSLRDGAGVLFFASALAVVALLARRGRPTPWPTLAWLGVFFMIGAYAARGVAWWPLGAVAAVTGVLATTSTATTRPERDGTPLMRRLNVVVAAALVLVGGVLLPTWRPTDTGLDAPNGVVTNAPSGITAALRDLAKPGDRLFNPQVWGSWFEFALPDVPVAIDSRIELFPIDVWNAYDRVLSGADGWEEQLDGWDVAIAVVQVADMGLVARLEGIGWRTVHIDGDGSILVAPDR